MILSIILKTVLSFLKTHWVTILILAAAIGIGGYNFYKTTQLGKIVAQQQQSFDAQIRRLQVIDQQQIAQRDEAIHRYETTVATIESRYEQERHTLNDLERQEIEQIVKETMNNPEELAHRINQATGFTVIMPTN